MSRSHFTRDQHACSHHFIPLDKLTVLQYGFSIGKEVRNISYCGQSWDALVGGLQEEILEDLSAEDIEGTVNLLKTILTSATESRTRLEFDKQILPVMRRINQDDFDTQALKDQHVEIEGALTAVLVLTHALRQEIQRFGGGH